MGSCFSSGEKDDACQSCKRKAVNNLIIINRQCEICIANQLKPRQESIQLRARFGEYRCACGRTWSSLLSWQRRYQKCIRCKKHVYPHTQREVRPSDMSSDKANVPEHQRELCEMCQQLGHFCGKSRSYTYSKPQTNRSINTRKFVY